MHNFETGRFVAPYSRSVALISCLALARCILKNDVRRLKDTDG